LSAIDMSPTAAALNAVDVPPKVCAVRCTAMFLDDVTAYVF
jgi:hypothetical protein